MMDDLAPRSNVPELGPAGDYGTNWKWYKILKRLHVVLLLLWFGLMSFWWVTEERLAKHYDWLPPILVILGLASLVGSLVVRLVLAGWKCPRCGNRFHSKGFWSSDERASQCMNCGLPKWA